MLLPRIVASLLMIASAGAPGAECTVHSGPQARALVELYTSEGCSSCPPADRWLSTLAASGDRRVVPIAFHVSYWDYIGWKDRFADARYTERQRDMAAVQGASMVYTPQVMIGGRDFRRWPVPGAAERAIDEIARSPSPAAITVSMKPVGDSFLEASASVSGAGALFVAITQDGLSSKVTAGENRGENLHHNAVVRDFAAIASGATLRFARKADWDLDRMSLVAFVQDPRTGRVVQALSAPLCR